MSNLPALPRLLREERETIMAAEGFAHRARVDSQRWLSTLPQEKELRELLREHPREIGRAELQDLSVRVVSDKIPHRRLFFAAMLWGFGSKGYGPYRVKQMLHGRQQLTDDLLHRIAKLIAAGDPVNALRELQASWLGVSFATKYLYAVGLAYEQRPQPLVLDLRVAVALKRLARHEGFEVSNFASIRYGEIVCSGSTYQNYIQLLDIWGDALGCPADRVEFFLFKHGVPQDIETA